MCQASISLTAEVSNVSKANANQIVATTAVSSMFLSLAQQKTNWKYLALHMGEHMLKSENCSSNNEITATEEAFGGFSIVQTKSGATAAGWCQCCSSRSWGCCIPSCLPPSALAQRSQGHWHLPSICGVSQRKRHAFSYALFLWETKDTLGLLKNSHWQGDTIPWLTPSVTGPDGLVRRRRTVSICLAQNTTAF